MAQVASRRVRFALAWVLLNALGGAVIALPDDDARLFSFSETHGPSPLDAVGMGLLAVGLVVYFVALWRGRARLAARLRRPASAAWAALAVAGGGLTGWSVATDAGAWWVAGCAMLLAVQAAVLRAAGGFEAEAR